MHVGGKSLTIGFTKRRLWFVISLVKASGIHYYKEVSCVCVYSGFILKL